MSVKKKNLIKVTSGGGMYVDVKELIAQPFYQKYRKELEETAIVKALKAGKTVTL